ncbi:NDR1/HIN1-like protein 6 [Vicia villosa]|uniref:NDR1/HIN1-like protein 6 n=1 Tax=Vicia villosa TaxID=3911 RepID=UPI00273B51C3|nr:NDR1/HIN1-like protein 6 [Vicia villosa]
MYQPQQQLSATKSLLCIFISVMSAIVVSLGVIMLIIYLVFKPRNPEFQVYSAQLTSLTLSGYYLTAKWNFDIIISNPNKKLDISYNPVSATVFYSKNINQFGPISNIPLKPFYQPKKSKALVRFETQVTNLFVGNGIASGIVNGQFQHSLQFGIEFRAYVIRKGLFHPKNSWLKVTCAPMNFVIGSRATIWDLEHPVKCNI